MILLGQGRANISVNGLTIVLHADYFYYLRALALNYV